MHYNSSGHLLVNNLYKLLSKHHCTVVPLMIEKQRHFEEFFRQKKGLRNHSVSVYDLNARRFTFHNSCYNKYLKHPSIYADLIENMQHLVDLTEKQNLIFCQDTLEKSYTLLMQLSREECEQFHVIYVRKMLEKSNQYHPYLHCMYVNQFDEQGNPWLITIETRRLPGSEIPEFRLFHPLLEDFSEEHAYSHHLQQLKLNENDNILLEKYRDDFGMKMKDLSQKMSMSEHTVSNIYNRVNSLFKVHSIQTTSILAGIIDEFRSKYSVETTNISR